MKNNPDHYEKPKQDHDMAQLSDQQLLSELLAELSKIRFSDPDRFLSYTARLCQLHKITTN